MKCSRSFPTRYETVEHVDTYTSLCIIIIIIIIIIFITIIRR